MLVIAEVASPHSNPISKTTSFGLHPPHIHLCSDKRVPFDRFLEGHGLGSALTKLIIPAGEANRFRDQLDQVGVDDRRLFPDLDGVAAEMRRCYS